MTSLGSHSSINCLLCCTAIVLSTDRYLVGGKGKVNFCAILKLVGVPFQTGKDYLCKSCSRKIEKHGKIADNLKKSKEEIHTIFNGRVQELNVKREFVDLAVSSSVPVPVAAKKACLHDDVDYRIKAPSPLCTSTPIKLAKPSSTNNDKASIVSGSKTEVKVSF